jgi:hypothetical protein
VPLVRSEKRTSPLPRLSVESQLSAESRERGSQSRLARLRHPVREVEAEAHHLHEIEREGERGETPFIAILGMVIFLLPIVVLVLGLAFAAYYLAV